MLGENLCHSPRLEELIQDRVPRKAHAEDMAAAVYERWLAKKYQNAPEAEKPRYAPLTAPQQYPAGSYMVVFGHGDSESAAIDRQRYCKNHMILHVTTTIHNCKD